MDEQYQQKPVAQYTNKEWRGAIIGLTFFGIFTFFIGLYQKSWETMKLGLIMAVIGIAGGFVLHYFFGIKIIQLRNNINHSKYK